jgi:DNA-binding CsgD family transcriptional regulator
MHRGADMHDFALDAARIVARGVPFDGVCVLAMDPATLLPTQEIVENGLPVAVMPRMAEIEAHGDDFNSFASLAGSGQSAASLSAATGGDLQRSRRHREVRRPSGFGDELRAVLADDGVIWGALTLLRGSESPDFTPAEAALVAALTRELAEGLRRATLFAALSDDEAGEEPTAGLVLMAADNTITLTNAAADAWLDELRTDELGEQPPPVVRSVATRARAVVDGSAESGAASARVRAPSGRWLLVRGTGLGETTAVIIEPVRPNELAPLIADAHGLTERERAVTELVAHGLGTTAIAARLHISPWTVQDHLKAVFEKVGVASRGELVARFFFAHHAPRLT